MWTQHLLEGEDALVSEVHLGVLRVLQLDRKEHRLLSLGPFDAWELSVQVEKDHMLDKQAKIFVKECHLLICSLNHFSEVH